MKENSENIVANYFENPLVTTATLLAFFLLSMGLAWILSGKEEE